jgi:EH_Signature domain
MMLRNAIARSLGEAPPLFAAPATLLAPLAKDLVERRREAERRRAPRDPSPLLQRLRQVDFDWQRVNTADRLDVATVLWEAPDLPAEHMEFLTAYLAWIDEPWRRIQACRLASHWVAAFDPHLPSIAVVGDWLEARAPRLIAPWKALADDYAIFDARRAPQRLADAFLAGDDSEAAFCARLGLDGMLATGGLMLEALHIASARVEKRLATEPHLAARLMDLAVHEGVFRPRAAANPTRAAAAAVKIIEALLLPWLAASPPERLKTEIVGFLLRHCQDARVNAALWRRVKPEAAALMRGWLAETTIEAFFRIAMKAQRDEPERLRARRRFWLSCRERIDDVWLIAGKESFAALQCDGLGHARLIGCPADHAALLLKIGGLTAVETSHAGSEHVWLPGNGLAPSLRRGKGETYLAAALASGADFSSFYSGEEAEEGEARLEEFIARHAGIVEKDAAAA